MSQLRSMLEVIKNGIQLPLERDSVVVVGVRNGENVDVRPVEEVLNSLYEKAREINETTLSDTLKRLFTSHESTEPSETRSFARRSIDR